MGKERLEFHLAGVFSSLQESYTYHVVGNSPGVGLAALA